MRDLASLVALLERTPASLDALLRGLPDAWIRAAEGPGTWTPFEIVGHLLHGERTDWMPRVQMILERGESEPFAPFDREAQFRDGTGGSMADRLGAFAVARRDNLQALRALHLAPSDLARRGRHPALGVVTLGQLLATWATHDLTHLHQLSRTLAHQCAGDVGPWQAYLGVLHCNGHGG